MSVKCEMVFFEISKKMMLD